MADARTLAEANVQLDLANYPADQEVELAKGPPTFALGADGAAMEAVDDGVLSEKRSYDENAKDVPAEARGVEADRNPWCVVVLLS